MSDPERGGLWSDVNFDVWPQQKLEIQVTPLFTAVRHGKHLLQGPLNKFLFK